ncbi:MAG: putative ABC transport system ATP-binding protein [Myxococcota bacterium]
MIAAVRANDLVLQRPTGFRLQVPEWSVPAGGRAVLHGPSGCGKSTLLSLISGEIGPTSGTLEVLGMPMATASDGARRAHRIRHMGLVFQDFPLVPHLDVLDNVLLPFRINPALALSGAARERAAGLLHDLGVGPLARRQPAQLSQGERQRVAIARALVTEPSLVLADEPTAGLDPLATARLVDLLDALVAARGVTLLLVSHDPAVIARFDTAVDVASFGGHP